MEIISYVGEDLPVRVLLNYQPYKPSECIDGIKNPEIEPSIDIKSISSFGFDIDDILTVQAVEKLRDRCLSILVNSKIKD